MCGIVGQIGPSACGREELVRMMGMLTHRGPDEAGLLVADGVSLGHLRLSIVDPVGGQQPMLTADGRYVVTFNGELFNHVELRRELEQAGHTFRTRCDTEVLLEAFRAWGRDCVHRFNGQWAFALWDRTSDTFFLARDRFGVRPLFFSTLPDGTVIFASEIKAILADARVSRSLDPEALRDIFTSWVCLEGRTPLSAIRQLPPGCFMEIREGRSAIRRYWDVDYTPEVVDWSRSDDSWREEVRALLSEACRLRLRADVTVGAYLSGGLDSSIITWLSRTHHQPNLQTFSIAFSDAEYDESHYQDLVARQIGSEHRRLAIARESIADHFEKTIWHTETPIHRTAPGPMMLLSGLVRDHGIKVVLTGEGADEVFGGYDQFKENKIRRFWAKNPGSTWRRRLLDRLEPNVPRSGQRTRAFWYAFYQEGLEQVGHSGYSHHPRWRNGMSLLPLLSSDRGRDAAMAWRDRVEAEVPDTFATWDPLSQAQWWEIRQFLGGYLLSSQGDRVAMANSVEGRYPFLDRDVFELSRRMPPRQKLRVLNEKHVLKQAFARDLPTEIVARKKYPYRAPDALALLHSQSGARLIDSLGPDTVRRKGLFHPESVDKLLGRVRRTPQPSARDNMALVLVHSAHVFHELFVEQPMRPSPLPPLKTAIDLTGSWNPVECFS